MNSALNALRAVLLVVGLVFLASCVAVCVELGALLLAATTAVKQIPPLAALRSKQVVDLLDDRSSLLVSQLGQSQVALSKSVAAPLASLSARAAATLHHLDAALDSANSSVAELAKLRADLSPILQDAAQVSSDAVHASALARTDSDLLLDCEANPQCLPNRIIGTNQAIERAAQSIERTSSAVADGIPPVLSVALKIGENSDRVTERTAEVMSHLALATHPLPTWMRIGLAVAPPLAGTAAGAATVYGMTK